MTVLLFRSIGGVALDVVISESHKAELEIAEHPVERGAKISDHAWRKPYSVEIEGVSLDVGTYDALLDVQRAAEPFDLVTGLKVYENMLLKELKGDRDKEKARVSYVTATCQEVIIVSTGGASPGVGGGLSNLVGGLAGALGRLAGSSVGSALNTAATKFEPATVTVERGEVQALEVPATVTLDLPAIAA